MMISLKNEPNSNPKQSQTNPILAQKQASKMKTNPISNLKASTTFKKTFPPS
jgi:hypothetical protein